MEWKSECGPIEEYVGFYIAVEMGVWTWLRREAALPRKPVIVHLPVHVGHSSRRRGERENKISWSRWRIGLVGFLLANFGFNWSLRVFIYVREISWWF